MSNLNTMQEIFNIAKDENIDMKNFDDKEWIVVLLTAIVKELQETNKLHKEVINYNIKMRQGCL